MAATQEQTEALVRRFLDGVLAADAGAITATLADGARLVLPRPTMAGRVIEGSENLADALVGLMAMYESPRSSYGTVVADGPHAVAEWRLSATIRSSGIPYEQFYCWVFDVDGDRIAEVREYIDTLYGTAVMGENAASTVDAHATAVER
jgi:ketosteroid isomerase-like protein